MSLPVIALAAILTIILALVVTLLSLGIISAKLSGIIMLIAPFLVNFFIDFLWSRDDLLGAICSGMLFSLAFGPATFVFGRILEKKVKEKKHVMNGHK